MTGFSPRAASFAAALLLLLVLGVAGPGVHDLLAWERAGLIARHEWWRVLTGHWVHLNVAHLAMNVVALALTLWLFRDAATLRRWWLVAIASALAISVALLLFDPQLQRYVGASGVIHGLLAFAAVRVWSTRRLEAALLLVGLAAKLGWEQWAGAAASSVALIGAPVIVDAHLYGAVAGLLFGLWPPRARPAPRREQA